MAPTEPEPNRPSRPGSRVALRVRFDNEHQSGLVDGAWWPQSRDLHVEVADLVDNLDDLIGRVRAVLYSRPDWDAVVGSTPFQQVGARGGDVQLGSFPSDDTHLVIITMQSGQRHRLLVIPSDTPPEFAEQVMSDATDERNLKGPAELLGLPGHDQNHIGLDIWNHS